jgi:hypothetical protein
MLPISANSFTEVMELPSIEQLRDYFNAHPQVDEQAHALIKIDAFSPPHWLLA